MAKISLAVCEDCGRIFSWDGTLHSLYPVICREGAPVLRLH